MSKTNLPIKLPGPLQDIAEVLGNPADAASVLKKVTKVGSRKLKDMSQDFNDADRTIRSIRIGRRQRRN